MTWPPVDSSDAAETRADLDEREQLEQRPHDERCRGGWLGEDHAGRPIPCTTCRPHVAGARRRLHRTLNGW